MSLQEFYKSLRQRKLAPVYFFYGEEDYLLDEAVDALIAETLPEESRTFNLDVLSAAEVDPRDIVARANSFPMMVQHRVVIVRDFDRLGEKNKDKEKGKERDPLRSYLENPSPTTILVLIAKKPDNTVRGRVEAIEFSRLDGAGIRHWIVEHGPRYGKQISREACEALTTYVGNSLRALEREIEKISIYVGDKKTIEIDDVNAVAGVSKTYNVFELSRAVGNRDLKRSLEILDRMMEYGEHPPLMVAVITKHFMTLLKNVERGQRLNSYSRRELERSFAYLARADEKLKFTSEDPRSVMTVLLHELMQ